MKVYQNMINSEAVPESGVKALVECNILRVFFDYEKLEEVKDSEGNVITSSNEYRLENVDVKNDRTYGGITSAIITDRYPSDKMDAVRLNYELANASTSNISDEKRTEYKNEYATMQAWRLHAKEVAAEVVKLIG